MDNTKEQEALEALRKHLKENGLEHGIRIMSVEERGEARRRIRAALEVYGRALKGELVERSS